MKQEQRNTWICLLKSMLAKTNWKMIWSIIRGLSTIQFAKNIILKHHPKRFIIYDCFQVKNVSL